MDHLSFPKPLPPNIRHKQTGKSNFFFKKTTIPCFCFFINANHAPRLSNLLFLLLFTSFFLTKGTSQTVGWQIWEPLYSDNYIQVEVQFYYPKISSCQTNGKDFKYKYRVKGKFRRTPYYLNWKMDYLDCQGMLNYQINSLQIGKSNPDDISNWVSIESMDYRLIATSIETSHYDIGSSSNPKSGTGTIVPTFSKEPSKIEGAKTIYMGESLELTVKGGVLGTGANWIWYQDYCGGKIIGQGTTIRISPLNTISVYVRAEGRNNITKCAQATINVDKSSLAPSGITGRDRICKGESISLTVSGGVLGQDAKWVWYTNGCGRNVVGTGSSIYVSPSIQTTYYVRAEGRYNTTICASITVAVFENSSSPGSISVTATTICEGQSVSLKVSGGTLAQDADWKWYAGRCGGASLASGSTATFYPNSTTTYFVRAEGICNYSSCASIKITVDPKVISAGYITAPPTIYKGRSTVLKISSTDLPPDTNWRWYKGGCGNGKFLGSGSTIKIRPRETETYYVKVVGKCSDSPCSRITITPIRLYQSDKFYSSDKMFLHFGWGAGVEWIKHLELAQHVTYGGVDSAFIFIQGLGLATEWAFHPIIKEYLSIGLIAGGAVGTTPKILNELSSSPPQNPLTTEEYLYTQWNYGGEVAIGLKKIKLLSAYKYNVQNNQFSLVREKGSSQEEKFNFEEDVKQETLGLGLRIGQYVKRRTRGGGNLDILFTFTQIAREDFPNFNFKRLPQSLHGIRLSWWRQSKFKLTTEFSIPNIEKPLELDDSNFSISLLFSFDRFY